MITFQIPEELKELVAAQEHIHLAVYTTEHDLVKSLDCEFNGQEGYTIRWDGNDRHGDAVCSGVYLLLIDAGVYRQDHKILVMR